MTDVRNALVIAWDSFWELFAMGSQCFIRGSLGFRAKTPPLSNRGCQIVDGDNKDTTNLKKEWDRSGVTARPLMVRIDVCCSSRFKETRLSSLHLGGLYSAKGSL